MRDKAKALLAQEINLYKTDYAAKNFEGAKHHLGRAHILSQNSVALHLYIHVLMLGYAAGRGEIREMIGQLLRLFVTIPGHLLGRVPKGNIGWASVGLTEEMIVPQDIEEVINP